MDNESRLDVVLGSVGQDIEKLSIRSPHRLSGLQAKETAVPFSDAEPSNPDFVTPGPDTKGRNLEVAAR